MFYVLDENHNLVEAFDKEGVLSALEKAIEDGSLAGITADSAFVSKLKCCVGGITHHIAFITQAKYNELKASGSLLDDCYYYITDDTTAEDIDEALQYLSDTVNSLQTQITENKASLQGQIDAINEKNAFVPLEFFTDTPLGVKRAYLQGAGLYMAVCSSGGYQYTDFISVESVTDIDGAIYSSEYFATTPPSSISLGTENWDTTKATIHVKIDVVTEVISVKRIIKY